MINVSNAFKKKIAEGYPVIEEVDITFPNGTVKTVNKEILNSGNDIVDGVDGSSFPVGQTVCKSLQLSLDNSQEQWKNYYFYGAKLRVKLKMELDDGTTETINRGTFTVTTPEEYGEDVELTALDDMYKANKTYTTSLAFPQDAYVVLQDACQRCGISLGTGSGAMEHATFPIQSVPDGMTFRDVIGCIAMIESANARIDNSGYLQLVKWDFSGVNVDNAPTVDSEGFIKFGGGSAIDSSGYISPVGDWMIDSDGFLYLNEGVNAPQRLRDYLSAPTLSTDNIIITGIQVKSGDASYQYGSNEYVLQIENTLLQANQLPVVAEWIGTSLIGKQFRSMEGDLLYNPLIEFGDMARTYDRKENVYITPITYVASGLNGTTTVKTQAESPIRGSSTYNSDALKTLIQAKKLVEVEKNARELAVEKLGEVMKNASGLYETSVLQEDGSTITYLHDKPTLEESKTIIKFTAEAIGVSNDGGKTYPYGFILTGDLITRILYAEGINADYINAGKLLGEFIDAKNLRVSTEDGTVTFYINEKGQVFIQPTAFFLSDNKTLDEAIADKTIEEAQKLTTLNVILSNEYQAIVTDANGNYTTFPECSTTVQVMYGAENVTNNASYTVTVENITGSWDENNHKYTVTGLSVDTGHVNFVVNYKTFSITKQFSIAKQKQGKQGDKGDSATTYVIETDATVIMRTADETYVPETVLFKNYVVSGNNKTLRKSNILVQTTTDGSTFSTIKNVDVDDGQYTLYLSTIASDVTAIRYIFRSINLGNPQLATVTIPIINDTELTEKQIFNLLTDNGTRDLLTYVDGKLYLNGTYIKGKTVAADKLNVEDLYAVAASIAQWTIKENYIQSKSGNIRLYSDGRIKIGNAVFSQSTDGDTACNIKYGLHLFCKNATDSSGITDPSGMFAISGLTSNASGSTLILHNNYVYKLSSSSKRYKKHVKNMTSSEAERLLDIPVVWFEYNEGYLAPGDRFEGKPLPGFYAEDVYEAFPEGAMLNEDGQVEDWNYRTMIPAMLKLIQDQQETINSLNKRIERLERGE
ncbi:MAG: tail fiber domain-containing protein [Roseburia sp.]|nr:tail fiber domain-containing protein [Roseburia sp.]